MDEVFKRMSRLTAYTAAGAEAQAIAAWSQLRRPAIEIDTYQPLREMLYRVVARAAGKAEEAQLAIDMLNDDC